MHELVASPVGVLAAAIVLSLALAAPAVRAQVSPGPLARAHAKLDTPKDCYLCHARGGGMTRRCLDCHTGIAAQRGGGRGLHGREARDRDCAGCHPDHAGREFDLVRWDEGSPERFEHRRTGYPLTGAHARLRCQDCHQARFQRRAAVAAGARPEPAHRWIGLRTGCLSCHTDPHRTRFGNDCEKCHSTLDWKAIEARRFDHDLTRYPLRGRHASARCEACHDPARPETRRPQFDRCGSCHRDAHAGQATLAGKAADCAACHRVEGFTPSSFTVAMHQRTRYPLEGRHATVRCAACHPQRAAGTAAVAALGSARVGLHPAFARCTSCHADAHGGQLAARADRGACESCHRVAGWAPSGFTVADHDRLAFPLDGAHEEAGCASCHAVGRRDLPPLPTTPAGTAGFVFELTERQCTQCHHDPHRGRFVSGGTRAKEAGCLACHDAARWRPARVTLAQHAEFGYPLESAHRAVPCTGCHAELAARPAASSLLLAVHPAPLPFDQARRACAACHEDAHAGQFRSRRDNGACDACHGVDAWRPAARFAHDRDTRFKLAGAHATVECSACHTSSRGSGGRVVTRYRGVPFDCASCHGPGGRTGGGDG